MDIFAWISLVVVIFFYKWYKKWYKVKIIRKDGLIMYFKGINIHRKDGPAIIYSSGNAEWWIEGIKIKSIENGIINYYLPTSSRNFACGHSRAIIIKTKLNKFKITGIR